MLVKFHDTYFRCLQIIVILWQTKKDKHKGLKKNLQPLWKNALFWTIIQVPVLSSWYHPAWKPATVSGLLATDFCHWELAADSKALGMVYSDQPPCCFALLEHPREFEKLTLWGKRMYIMQFCEIDNRNLSFYQKKKDKKQHKVFQDYIFLNFFF